MGLSWRASGWRVGGAVTMAAAMLATGCDRGDHPGQIDRIAPQFSLNDGEHAVDLHSLRGHVVLLNFWATWCAPCIQEMPSLEALQQALPQVKIVAVATDEDAEAYHAFLERQAIPLLTVFDASQSSNTLYGTFRFPESYVIDKQGMIRRKYIGPQDWTSPEIVNSLRKLAD
ncbi:MAG: TlpA family protein disulfide reductase [Janthinobacterium lividum]